MLSLVNLSPIVPTFHLCAWLQFEVKESANLGKILDVYATKRSIAVKGLRFLNDEGRRIDSLRGKTVSEAEFEDGDEIVAVLEQVGGSDDDVIMVQIKDADGKALSFKIKKKTKLRKVLNAYANAKQVDVKKFKFLIDGNRLSLEEDGDKPVKMLEIEDGDQIDAMVEQQGGSFSER